MFRLILALVLISFVPADALACGGMARRTPLRTLLSHFRLRPAGESCQPAAVCVPAAAPCPQPVPAPKPAPKPEPKPKHHHESAAPAPVVPAPAVQVNVTCGAGGCAHARPQLFRLFR